jgi:ubiquinone/menaquinone biosynthesis C-methylase UbiE
MILGYFEDMYLSLKELYRVTKKGGHVCYVVRNSRFSGSHFETDCYCADIGEQLGFNVKEILVPLLRGTSSQQGKKYGEFPLRESVVVFQK